jgi:hypothetical protein
MVLVHNQNILRDEHASLKMDSISRVNLRTPVNNTIIVDQDYRIALFRLSNAQA